MLKHKENGYRRKKLLKWWELEKLGINYYKFIDTTFDGFRGTFYYVDGALSDE